VARQALLKCVLGALLLGLIPLAAFEVWLRGHLFDRVAYSNSAAIDAQLRARDAQGPWNVMFVGDSEVRWGIDPAAVDAGASAAGAPAYRTFNHAFDGFGASWWLRLLPALLRDPSLAHVDTVVLGVQLIDLHRTLPVSGMSCGSLQQPVLTSSFAIDHGWESLCRDRSWDARLGRDLFDDLWTVRYASAVRSLVLPGHQVLAMNSRSLRAPERGFQAHRPIAQDPESYADEFARWKAQYKPARDFVPLPAGAWEQLVRQGGFFDELESVTRASGKRLALFALPTNPVVIDTFRRRDDYQANSRLLAQWAAAHRVPYVDLGIQDRADSDTFFSDMRHLSGPGATVYSRDLGAALVKAGLQVASSTQAAK